MTESCCSSEDRNEAIEAIEAAPQHAGRGVAGEGETSLAPFRGQRGQSLFEYAMIILFVALAVVVGLALIAPSINHIFNQVPNAF